LFEIARNLRSKNGTEKVTKARAIPTIAFAIFLATITATGAQKSKRNAAADYFPLHVDDFWTYRNTSGDGEYSLKVLSEEKQTDGSTRYLVEMLSGVKIDSLFSKTNGWVLMHGERYPEHEGMESKYEPAKQHLPNPLVAGTKWEWKGKDVTQTDLQEMNKVIGFEKVTVPAGKFRAMKVVSQVTGASPFTKTYWYADGVGLVKSKTEGGKISYNWELVDYSFKKKAEK
jgi:hypothetical protein